MKKLLYPHGEIEKKWQETWSRKKLNSAPVDTAGKPFYNLMMFPYPSAEGLHVGNMYAFAGSDIFGRFKRMQGYDVFEPIGLDGFGIHSENYALKIGRHPMDHAKITEKNFYQQLHKIGAMFDWGRTVQTYDIDYYRWTQWLFVQMFKHGLAYRNRAEVNWCPSDKTVLADEQVINGACERCGNIVEKRSLEQWFFRITAYAGKLLENSFSLDWSEKVKVAQKNWIGKKEGINITYRVVDENEKEVGEVICFTTRPDTNFGATFVVIAPEHPFVSRVLTVIKTAQADRITKYVSASSKKTTNDRLAEGKKKTGVATGLYCVNQLNNKKMPLYISDFVVMGFGTGAVVGVPGHDLRDFEFAKAFDLPVVRVVRGTDGDTSAITKKEQVQEENGQMMNSDFLDGLDIHTATVRMMDYLEKKGWGKRIIMHHLRDWLISRQRYWGPPIPMIFCKVCADNGKSWFTTDEGKPVESGIMNHESGNHNSLLTIHDSMNGWYPVPESDLPVVLPRIDDYRPGDDGIAPLAKHREFYETKCPGCGAKATRETDVSDTFLDSSWYFLRYPSVGVSDAGTAPFDKKITKKWLPVNMYTGGAEHSVLHLMYSRFVTMALKDWGYIDFDEPFTKFYAHGLVIKDGAKMSKSKGNVVNPDEYIELYGADALRLYLMFMGPFDQGGDFRDSAMEGMSRWIGRVWRLGESILAGESEKKIDPSVHNALQKLIAKVTDDMEKRRYNTAIAGMMEFTNLVADCGGTISREDFQALTLLLAPFAPHTTEELWSRLHPGEGKNDHWSVHQQSWPSYVIVETQDEMIPVVVQVNGKVRAALTMSKAKSGSRPDVETAARANERISTYLSGQTVRKVIFVPGKLINFVI